MISISRKLKKIYLLAATLIITYKSFSQNNSYNSTYRYPITQLQEDFRFLRTNLETIHPDLYLYTSKAEFSFFFDSLYKSISSSLTGMEFYNLITLLNAKIKDGHTMFLPGEATMHYLTEKCKFLPLDVITLHNKLYVTMNISGDKAIQEGAEIISINGVSASGILDQLLARQIRDGNNLSYAYWILTNYFKEYFGFLFGHADAYSVIFKKEHDDKLQNTTIVGLSKDSIKMFSQKKYSGLPVNAKQGISLQLDLLLNTAMLTIRSFSNNVLKSEYNQDFKSTIKRTFSQILNHHVTNLIIDLRDNQGGDFETGRFLLSQLLLQPVKYLANTSEYKDITPRRKNYKGKVYVLINGGSFSNTAIVSSYLQLTNRAIFIGQETGGNKSIISGNAHEFIMPNTKIRAEISTEKFVIRNAENDGHGVLPAYYIFPSMCDIVMNKDVAKQFAFHLALKKENIH